VGGGAVRGTTFREVKQRFQAPLEQSIDVSIGGSGIAYEVLQCNVGLGISAQDFL
jgi:hypothetical protein